MESDKSGKPLKLIDNFLTVMINDRIYGGVRFNLMTQRPEIHGATADSVTEWTDTDSAESERYIQSMYHLTQSDMHQKALRILFRRREYNPLFDLIESFKWDGYPRIEECLSTVLKADSTPYTREVSRLIFAGGINRLYEPGCKFDCIPILIGKQGSGKTSFVEMLALNSNFYAFTKNLSGDQRSIEALSGAWFVEIAELAGFRNADIESLKAFTTARFDRYRLPFDRNVSTLPRRCCFIGTTNSHTFLTDTTGNRRFFPIEVHSDGYEVLRCRAEIEEYICQAWAEARERYKAGVMEPVPNADLIAEYRKAQENASVEDWRVGVIEQYVQNCQPGHDICTKEIFRKALYPDGNREQSKKESVEIGQILDGIPDLEKLDRRTYTEDYGQQRCWRKKNT